MLKLEFMLYFVALLFVPFAARSDTNARIMCMGNLKQIDGAVQQWVQENHLSDTNTYRLSDGEIVRYLPKGRMLICPSGGTYAAGKTVLDDPRCTFHGSIEDMQREYLLARQRHNRMQIGMGVGAALLAWLTLRWLKFIQHSGRIKESTEQILVPSVVLLLGLLVFAMPQDSLRPSFGIVHPILHVPTAVLFVCGLVVTVRTMLVGRKIPLVILCVFSVVFVLLLRMILLWWLTVLRR